MARKWDLGHSCTASCVLLGREQRWQGAAPSRNNGILILAWKTAKDKEWLSSGWLEDEKKKRKKKSCVEKYFDVGSK